MSIATVLIIACIIFFSDPTTENTTDKEPVKIEHSHNLLTPDK